MLVISTESYCDARIHEYLKKKKNILSMPNTANIQTTFSYFNKTRYVHPKQIHLTREQNIILLEVTYHQVPIVFFFPV